MQFMDWFLSAPSFYQSIIVLFRFVVHRLRRRFGRLEHVVALERNLKTISDTRHVMAAARPPDDIESTGQPEASNELVQIFACDRPRRARLLAREEVSDSFGGGKIRPVCPGQLLATLGDFLVFEARDREQHFGMTHSVKTLQAPRNDPEERLFEDAVL